MTENAGGVVAKPPSLQRIRQEIRTLTPMAWQQIVDALWIMKTIKSTIAGRQIYGKEFISYDDLVSKHAIAALDNRGDQAHFSPVFSLFHRAWLLELENSIIAVDNNINGLPYWDFTANLVCKKSVFTPEYFGQFANDPPDYIIEDGKFAFWKIKRLSRRENHSNVGALSIEDSVNDSSYNLSNSCGLMRHPLSKNYSPFATRRGGIMCGSKNANRNMNAVSQSWNSCLKAKTVLQWFVCVASKE